MEFKVSATEPGNTKEIAGYQTKEMVLRMEMQATDQKSGQQGSMVISSDIWLAPSVAGYQEVRAFYTRMGEKLAFNPRRDVRVVARSLQEHGELYKEIGKLDGIPVLQTISMGVPASRAPETHRPSRAAAASSNSSSSRPRAPRWAERWAAH